MREKPWLKPATLNLAISLSITVIVTVILLVADEIDWWRIPPVSLLVFVALYATFRTENKS